MSFLNRIPFLPKEQGKRELVFFFTLAGTIMVLGLIGGMTGLLYKDVPESEGTPVAIEATAPATEPAPFVTPDE